MIHLTLDEVEKLLQDYPLAKDLFAKIPRKDLLFATHHDRNNGDKRAAELFKRIEELDKWVSSTIKSPKGTSYQLDRLITTGDVSDIYQSGDYLIKISRVPKTHELLLNEKEMLEKLSGAAGTLSYWEYLPKLIESFPARDVIQKRVNVFKYEKEFVSLEKVHDSHHDLDPKHIAWIFKRLLTILGFVHRAGVVHGAVLPCHILINPNNHGLQLIGWGHSVLMKGPKKKEKVGVLDDLAEMVEEIAGTITTISAKHRSWYPPEILAKRPVSQESDLYMAAKCMLYLSGDLDNSIKRRALNDDGTSGCLPKRMRMFFNACLLDGQCMRPGPDCWKVLEEFDVLLRGIFGKPKFIALEM